MSRLAPGWLGRRISRQKRKSVVMKKRNAAVARSGSAVVEDLKGCQ
jgi:hypothetical protein